MQAPHPANRRIHPLKSSRASMFNSAPALPLRRPPGVYRHCTTSPHAQPPPPHAITSRGARFDLDQAYCEHPRMTGITRRDFMNGIAIAVVGVAADLSPAQGSPVSPASASPAAGYPPGRDGPRAAAMPAPSRPRIGCAMDPPSTSPRRRSRNGTTWSWSARGPQRPGRRPFLPAAPSARPGADTRHQR